MEILTTQLEKVKNQWATLAKREQLMIAWGSCILFFVLYYFLFYSPMQDSIDTMKKTLVENESLYSWMQDASQDIKKTQSSTVAAAKKLPLLSLIENTLKSAKLNQYVNEIKLQKENQVQIKLNDVNFEKSMRWLETLNKTYSLSINKVILRATDEAGIIQMDATVQR